MRFEQPLTPIHNQFAPPAAAPGLRTWNAEKQQAYQAAHAPQALVHLLLDASGSMAEHQGSLVTAVNRYESWLQKTLAPISMAQRWLFAGTVYDPTPMHALSQLIPLSMHTYDPYAMWERAGGRMQDSGTNLYDALGRMSVQAHEPGQHILVVFTDGDDTGSETWSIGQVRECLKTLIAQESWLAVYLGAHTGALQVGKELGFAADNCLEFKSDKLPEAFSKLQQATMRFLQAPEAERKILAMQGVMR